MQVSDLDTYRKIRASKEPLFYLDSPVCKPCKRCGYAHGTHEEMFTTLEEARASFERLAKPGHVEYVHLYRQDYREGAGYGRTILDEWTDTPAEGAETE